MFTSSTGDIQSIIHTGFVLMVNPSKHRHWLLAQ
jgi:hypothetical protein